MLIISTLRKPRDRPTYGDSSLRISSFPHLSGSLFNGLPADAALTGAAFPPTVSLLSTDYIQWLTSTIKEPSVKGKNYTPFLRDVTAPVWTFADACHTFFAHLYYKMSIPKEIRFSCRTSPFKS